MCGYKMLTEGDNMGDFAIRPKTNTVLSDSSIYQYSHATDTVMDELLVLGAIDKLFSEMNEIEIDIVMAVILHDQHFIKKNTTWNAMYSNALKQYRTFKRDETVVDTEAIRISLQQENIPETERQELVEARVVKGSSERGPYNNMTAVALSPE